ncbi:MAG TPA: sulfite exporter TauE/SafE family protein [Candidatus Limnocylindria bacterium]|jgi:uncharacterized membrane protein YfcA
MDAAPIVGLAALIASFLSGLLGIGGGLILTPLLLDLPPLVGAPVLSVKLITGLTMVQAISGSLLGVVRHHGHGNVSKQTLRVMGPTIAIASLGGALLSSRASDQALLLVFAGVATIGAIALVIPGRADPATDPRRRSVPLALGVAALLGIFGGMVGIGGVAFIIPVLIHLVGLPARTAIGTSLGLGLFSSAAGLAGKAATAQVDPFLALVVAVSAAIVAPIGVAASVRTPVRALTSVLAALVLITAIRVALAAVAI